MATRLTSTTQVGLPFLHYLTPSTLLPLPFLILLDTSEESKQHSKEVLDQEYDGGNIDKSGDKNPQNVAGGLKAYVAAQKRIRLTVWNND